MRSRWRSTCARPNPSASAPDALVEVEVIGEGGRVGGEIERLCSAALSAAGVSDGHVAVEFVEAERIQSLNREHRGRDEPTDVLSFPVDEAGTASGPRELGDIVICPEHTADQREAVVHGALHLAGLDHETDDGEMLALQDRLMSELS